MMDPRTHLNQSFSCSCGRPHTLPIRQFLYATTLYEQIPRLLIENGVLVDQTGITIAADRRTWEVCGERVWNSIGDFTKRSFVIVPDRHDGGPVCDRDTKERLKKQVLKESPGFLLAVGSGVINDLCKWVAFELDLYYGVVATAASMNGYSSANAAPLIDGVKVLIRARPPVFVGADPAVVGNAPFAMTAAGFGDTIAKFQSCADWRMNHLLFDEYYCDFCSGLLDSVETRLLEQPAKIKQKDPEMIQGLFEALFWSGAAMTLVGTSVPASGGEHLLSHTLDMASAAGHHRHDLHGRQVGLGTIFSAALYERILLIENPAFVRAADPIDRGYWKEPAIIAAVEAQYEQKKPFLQSACRKLSDPDCWRRLQQELKRRIKSPDQIKQWLKSAGGASTAGEIGLTKQQLLQAALHMHEIRKRFTVVDLALLLGILPGAAEEIIDHYMQ